MADISLDLNPLSPTHKDFLVVDGDLVLTSDSDPKGTHNVLQHIVQRLSFFLGEWFMDNTKGVPWFTQILVKNPQQAKIDALLMNTIMGTPGVTQLVSYSFSPDTAKRTLSVQFSVYTTNGKVDYTGAITV